MDSLVNVESKVYSNKGNQAVIGQVFGENARILDIGCGAGDNARILKSLGHRVEGITFSQEEMSTCSLFMDRVYLHNLEEGLPVEIQGEYDFIICSHVLEHIAYPSRLLKGLHGIMGINSRLIVALPNVMHYRSRWKLMIGEFPVDDSGIWDYTHLRWYTFKTGQKLLEDYNFVLYKKFVDGDIPLLSLFSILPKAVRNNIYKMFSGISKGFFGGQLVYIVGTNKNGNI